MKMTTRSTTPSSRSVIGLIGGMSWESTAEYYRLANIVTRDRLGALHSARILLDSVDFADIEPLQVAGRWYEAGQIMADAAQRLEAAGADLLLICTNTMHIAADQVQAAVRIPLLHIADVAASAVKSAGLNTVGLLGTAFTMEQSYYRDRIESHGLTVIIPPDDDRAAVHRIIYDELCLGQLREESRQLYRDIIGRLIAAGAQGIILGCTEIELLITGADSPVPTFPTTRLHVMAALDAARAADASTKRPGGSGGAATSDLSH
jgi:aspartate racemase